MTFHGHYIRAASPREIVRLGVALVPEGRQVFGPMTVEENLVLGAYRDGARTPIVRERMAAVHALFPVLRERARRSRLRCPVASSRCSRSGARSWPGPGCCWSTSCRSGRRPWSCTSSPHDHGALSPGDDHPHGRAERAARPARLRRVSRAEHRLGPARGAAPRISSTPRRSGSHTSDEARPARVPRGGDSRGGPRRPRALRRQRAIARRRAEPGAAPEHAAAAADGGDRHQRDSRARSHRRGRRRGARWRAGPVLGAGGVGGDPRAGPAARQGRPVRRRPADPQPRHARRRALPRRSGRRDAALRGDARRAPAHRRPRGSPRARRRGVLPGAVHDGARADRDAGGGGVSRTARAPRRSSSSTRDATAISPSSASPPPACPRPTGAGAGFASGSAPSPTARATRAAPPRGLPARASNPPTSRRRRRAAWRRPSRPRTCAPPPSTGGTSSRSSWSARSTSWRGGDDTSCGSPRGATALPGRLRVLGVWGPFRGPQDDR